jgi:hypothetical protein
VPKDAKPTGEPTPDGHIGAKDENATGAAATDPAGSPLNRLRRFFSSDKQ